MKISLLNFQEKVRRSRALEEGRITTSPTGLSLKNFSAPK